MPKSKAGGSWIETLWRDALVILFLALAVLVVLDQANPLTTRLGRDSGVFAYVGSHILRGKVLYVDVWDHKAPAVYFINAAALWIGQGSRWGIWLTEYIFLLGAAILGFAALKQMVGDGAALLASFAWLAALGAVLQGGNFTEEYALLFSFAALWLFTRIVAERNSARAWPHVGMGVALGLAVLTRPNNAGAIAAMLMSEVLLVIFNQRSWRWLYRVMAATATGLAVPILGVAIYFILSRAFADFWNAAFVYNLYYGGRPDLPAALVAGVQNFGALAGIAAVGIWMAAARARAGTGERTVDPLCMWLVVDAMLEVVLSGLSGRNYAHYFISWLPWMALAFALPFGHVVRTMRAWGRASQVLAIMAGLTIAVGGMRDTMSEYGATFSKLFKEDALVQRREVLAEYVNAHTAPGDTVLVWGGGAGLNFLSRRDSPSAYFTYGILSASPITRDLSAAFYTDILERPPALIVDESAGDLRYIVPALSELSPVEWSESMQVDVQPYVEELFAYFRTHYELKTTVAGIPIYSRSR